MIISQSNKRALSNYIKTSFKEMTMIRNLMRITITMTLLVFGTTAVYAAGSSPKPATDRRPGISEYNAGVTLMKEGRFDKAQAKFEAALAKNPDMAEAHNNLGYSLRKQGAANFDKALTHYNRAIELDPKLAEAYMYRGVLHMRMGNEAKALEDHRALAQMNRQLADALQAAIASGEEPDGLAGLAKSW
jgi:tetratricopeptide (TPR) repeat protein